MAPSIIPVCIYQVFIPRPDHKFYLRKDEFVRCSLTPKHTYMKLLFVLLLAFSHAPLTLVVIDMNAKKPIRQTDEFSMEQYMARDFPVYADDLKALAEATEKAAKLINRKTTCESSDTLTANHTSIIVQVTCNKGRSITVRYVTEIKEKRFRCDFDLIRHEENARHAQVKLIEFASYLAQ